NNSNISAIPPQEGLRLGGPLNNRGTIDVQTGSLVINGDVTNTMLIGLDPKAVVSVTGTYSQIGSLRIMLGGAPATHQFGRLLISGAATLSGTLDLELANGFVAAPTDTCVVATYGSETGDFGVVTGNATLETEQTNPDSIVVAEQIAGAAA